MVILWNWSDELEEVAMLVWVGRGQEREDLLDVVEAEMGAGF